MRNFFWQSCGMSLPDRLRSARKKKYPSARAATAAIGVPESTYYGHENGSREPSRDDIARYARLFGVSPQWLAHGIETLAKPAEPSMVKIAGETQAGLWREAEMWADEAPAPARVASSVPEKIMRPA